MTPLVAWYANAARAAFERLPESARLAIREAVRRLARNPQAGYWIRESEGLTLRLLPVGEWRVFYVVWESELVVTVILHRADAPRFLA